MPRLVRSNRGQIGPAIRRLVLATLTVVLCLCIAACAKPVTTEQYVEDVRPVWSSLVEDVRVLRERAKAGEVASAVELHAKMSGLYSDAAASLEEIPLPSDEGLENAEALVTALKASASMEKTWSETLAEHLDDPGSGYYLTEDGTAWQAPSGEAWFMATSLDIPKQAGLDYMRAKATLKSAAEEIGLTEALDMEG